MFLLEIDEATMLARLDARQDNEWGPVGSDPIAVRPLTWGFWLERAKGIEPS